MSATQAGAVGGYASDPDGWEPRGGGNATPIVVNSLAAMQSAINAYTGSGGLVLHYSGSFDPAPILANICGQWSLPKQEVSISSKNDVTILGLDGSSANFGIRIRGTSGNVVVQNMTIGLVPGGASDGDMIGIQDSAHHIWIDHNTLYSQNFNCAGTPGDGTTFDGALDIKNSADNITVSNNHFHDHAKIGLDGSSDSDSSVRRLTFSTLWLYTHL